MSSNYLISGIGPGKGGVGTLVQSLELRKNNFNYRSLYVKNPSISILSLFKKRKLVGFFYELIMFFYSLLITHIRLLFIRNKKIILIYPQYFHTYFLERLIKNNEVALYVMDNSFFCIKSYNYLNGKECFNCISSSDNIDKSCTPSPRLWSKKNTINKLKKLKFLSNDIFFLSQNQHQSILLKKVFGEGIRGDIVGMDAGEFSQQLVNSKTSKFDIVFHGGSVDAKGALYVIEIAKHLSQYNFLIPFTSSEIICNLPNVHFIDCSWSTGLMDYVLNAKLVMCPSIWSSPIEGALLKSIAYNGNVAVYDNKFGFQNDIDPKAIIRLSDNMIASAEIVDEFISSKNSNSEYAKKWLKSYCLDLDDKKIFNWGLEDNFKRVALK